MNLSGPLYIAPAGSPVSVNLPPGAPWILMGAVSFIATCACNCGCGARVPDTQVMCSWCANGHKSPGT